jgi:hypothetical protein
MYGVIELYRIRVAMDTLYLLHLIYFTQTIQGYNLFKITRFDCINIEINTHNFVWYSKIYMTSRSINATFSFSTTLSGIRKFTWLKADQMLHLASEYHLHCKYTNNWHVAGLSPESTCNLLVIWNNYIMKISNFKIKLAV